MYQLENMMHNGDAVVHPSQPEVVPIRLLAELLALLPVQLQQLLSALFSHNQTFKDTGRKLIHSSDPSSSKPG